MVTLTNLVYRLACTHMHTKAALRASSLHDPQTGKRISPRSMPVSAQAGSDSQPIARKPLLTVAACTPRKLVE